MISIPKVKLNRPRNVYYNVQKHCDLNSKDICRANYRSNRTTPILDEPDLYEVAVVRFSIPTDIPLFIYPTDPDTYKIQLRWKTSEITKQLIYVDPCSTCLYNRGIYNQHTFIDILNSALEEARTELKILDPTFPSTAPIFFNFDPATQLFSLYVESSFGSSDDFSLNMTEQLYLPKFTTFESSGDFSGLTTALSIKMIIENRQLNNIQIGAVNYLKITQDSPTIINWNEFTLMTFESSMPISGEFESASVNILRSVLTDFSISGISSREYVNYFPQGPLRWYNIDSKYPLTEIDVQTFVTYQNGEIFPLYLNRGSTLSMKLQFRLKDGNNYEEETEEV